MEVAYIYAMLCYYIRTIAKKSLHIVHESFGRDGEISFAEKTVEGKNAKEAINVEYIEGDSEEGCDPADQEEASDYQKSLLEEIVFDEAADRAYWIREEECI